MKYIHALPWACLGASPHHISTLSAYSAPSTVRGLRSFIGAYKVLAKVLPQCACMIGPLDDVVAGQSSSTSIQWTDEILKLFKITQMALSNNKVITLPRSKDQLAPHYTLCIMTNHHWLDF